MNDEPGESRVRTRAKLQPSGAATDDTDAGRSRSTSPLDRGSRRWHLDALLNLREPSGAARGTFDGLPRNEHPILGHDGDV